MYKTIIFSYALIGSIAHAYTTNTYHYYPAMANNVNKDNRIYEECIEPHWYRKYYFFSANESDINYYAIKTSWLVLHDNKIKQSLIKAGVHIFKSNPSDKCGWLQNKDYDWKHDRVLIKNNATSEMDVIAYEATKQNCMIEWWLIFIWAWGPIGIIILISIGYYIYDRMEDIYKAYNQPKPEVYTSVV